MLKFLYQHKVYMFILCILITLSVWVIHTVDENVSENVEIVELSSLDNAIALATEKIETVELSSEYDEPVYVYDFIAIDKSLLEDEIKLSNEEIELIALLTMAEAEGECEEGMRLVIDTVLNRVDSEYYPDTVYDVIYQPRQFSSMWNGRVDRCEARYDICQMVKDELKSRTNYDVIFFTAGNYSAYGTPMFQVENHYFSSYD